MRWINYCRTEYQQKGRDVYVTSSCKICPRRDAAAPENARNAEVLIFNSGGSGARLSGRAECNRAFPSGVMTMPVEATEQVGPVIIWRKELRAGSGGAGRYRGGLGQNMDVGVTEDMNFFCKPCLTGCFTPHVADMGRPGRANHYRPRRWHGDARQGQAIYRPWPLCGNGLSGWGRIWPARRTRQGIGARSGLWLYYSPTSSRKLRAQHSRNRGDIATFRRRSGFLAPLSMCRDKISGNLGNY